MFEKFKSPCWACGSEIKPVFRSGKVFPRKVGSTSSRKVPAHLSRPNNGLFVFPATLIYHQRLAQR